MNDTKEPIPRAVAAAELASSRPVVIVESPFAGKGRTEEEIRASMEANRKYAIDACVDCIRRGEVPYASHLFFPQFLDELKPEERELGLTAGYAMWSSASRIVFYEDLGFSLGMERAWKRAISLSFIRERRRIR